MRVLFLQQQPCVRTLKYAAALRPAVSALGFAYQGRTLTEWYGTGDELFDRWWQLGGAPERQLARVVEEFRPDVVHAHNLPDSLTVVAQAVCGDRVPVVHDVHDLQSLRKTPYEAGFPEPDDPEALERMAVEASAAVVAVSTEMLAEMEARYAVPARRLVFANYALGRDLPESLPPPDRPRVRPFRVVYQGTLSANGGHYDLRDLFRAIVGAGVELHVYPGRPAPGYEAMDGIHVHATLPPERLLAELPEYDFGWAGFNATVNGRHLDTALPNKAFEYLGCGLPVLTLDHRALRRVVTEEGVGVSLHSLEGLDGQLAALDVVALRERVAAVRRRFTVEAHADELTRLYRAVA